MFAKNPRPLNNDGKEGKDVPPAPLLRPLPLPPNAPGFGLPAPMQGDLPPSLPANYSHSFRYTSNPQRRSKNEVLAFESPFYGLIMEKNDLRSVRFKNFDPDHPITFLDCLKEEHRDRMEQGFNREDFLMELEMDGEIYKGTHAREEPRLWEAGKICQRYDFPGVDFHGLNVDNFEANLVVVAWPDSVTFKVDITFGEDATSVPGRANPQMPPADKMTYVPDKFTFTIKFKDWEESNSFVTSNLANKMTRHKPPPLPINVDEPKKKYVTILSCNLTPALNMLTDKNMGVAIEAANNADQKLTTAFDKSFNCFLVRADDYFKRPFKAGYRCIKDYDEIEVKVSKKNCPVDSYVPVLLYIEPLANPTGLCPIICDDDYNPTGIPIQLSKNWHLVLPSRRMMYGRFFTYLPAKGNSVTTYRIRIPYGFYGSLPVASHANLSLVGMSWTLITFSSNLYSFLYLNHGNFPSLGYYGHGTRWEQLAIGCWGETFCMDIDMGCTNNIITDVRMLMGKGDNNLKWRWTDAGWGGDWGVFYDPDKLQPFHWKTAHVSHGPCLTDARYAGWYGVNKKVFVSASVNTSRTDDYCRTNTKLKYVFRGYFNNIPRTSFFQLGSTWKINTPTIAWGNVDGLLGERHLADAKLKPGMYLYRQEMDGDGPWWFGFPGQILDDNRKWGKGWRACVIRNYKASFGGQIYDRPSFSLWSQEGNKADLDFYLQSPEGVVAFNDGDWVSFEFVVLTFPKDQVAYYGPNENFKAHLEANPSSWKTVHREVAGNNVSVAIESGGDLLSNYPIEIAVTDEEAVHFTISGGIGAVPVKFSGLFSREHRLYQLLDGKEIPLDQTLHKNDFWQTEFTYDQVGGDGLQGRYDISFNLELDSFKESRWIFRSTKELMDGEETPLNQNFLVGKPNLNIMK